jgi:hypothetical protein
LTDLKTRMCLRIVLAALLTSILIAQPQRFAIAIVRLDGRIVPFAAYDGGRWERAWPEADEATDAPPTIDNIPSVWSRRGDRVPSVWRVWPASGGMPIQAQVSGVEVVEAHCEGQVALKTDLTAAKAEHPRKFGVAVDSSSLPIGAIEEVPHSDVQWRAAGRTVLASFSRLEAAQLSKNRQQLPRETPAPVAQITALYREAKSPGSPVHFVAEKRFRTPRFPQNRQCTAVTFITGWLVPTDAGLTLLDPKVFLTDCDAKDVRAALPLATLRISGQLFWVLQEHGYEDETYLIAEIRQSDVRYPIEVNGGGC